MVEGHLSRRLGCASFYFFLSRDGRSVVEHKAARLGIGQEDGCGLCVCWFDLWVGRQAAAFEWHPMGKYHLIDCFKR